MNENTSIVERFREYLNQYKHNVKLNRNHIAMGSGPNILKCPNLYIYVVCQFTNSNSKKGNLSIQ